MPIRPVTLKTAQGWDKKAIYKIGLPRIVLMENAGRNVAEFVISKSKPQDKIIVLAGTGHNGSDGLVAARHLKVNAREVSVFIVGDRLKAKDATMLEIRILENSGFKIKEIKKEKDIKNLKQEIKGSKFLIDAMLGIGIKGEARELTAAVIKYINSVSVKKVALDIPSGLDADKGKTAGLAVRADYTVTFQAVKKGMLKPEAKKFCGKIIITKIGLQ